MGIIPIDAYLMTLTCLLTENNQIEVVISTCNIKLQVYQTCQFQVDSIKMSGAVNFHKSFSFYTKSGETIKRMSKFVFLGVIKYIAPTGVMS